MRLTIFGGSGFTGTEVVKYALKNGHKITLLLRNVETLDPLLKESVTIIVGDVTDATQVSRAVEGCEAVIVTLGTRNSLEPTTQMSTGLRNILNAMAQHGVTPITVCLSSFLYIPEKLPESFQNIHKEHMAMLQLLKESHAKWVGLCAPHIAKEPSTQTVQLLNEQRVGPRIWVGHLAQHLVELLSKSEHHKHQVGIGYPPE